MAEWLRRWTANPLGSPRVGSNPILVVLIFTLIGWPFPTIRTKCKTSEMVKHSYADWEVPGYPWLLTTRHIQPKIALILVVLIFYTDRLHDPDLLIDTLAIRFLSSSLENRVSFQKKTSLALLQPNLVDWLSKNTLHVHTLNSICKYVQGYSIIHVYDWHLSDNFKLC